MPFAIGSLSLRSNAFDRLLSDASYSLYLVHWLPLLFILHYLPQIADLPHAARALATAPLVLLAYAAAFGLTLCVDRPCGRARALRESARRETRCRVFEEHHVRHPLDRREARDAEGGEEGGSAQGGRR